MLTYAGGPWRVILAATIAALLIAALPQAAEAAPTKRQRCIAAAEKALGRDIVARNYRIVLGTNRSYEVLRTRENRKDLICGFGGGEEIASGSIVRPGDIFISGKGGSLVREQAGGVVIGGKGENIVQMMDGGRFEGRANRDVVEGLRGGVFLGGDGADTVLDITKGGRFIGGRGADAVYFLIDGVFLGERGADRVDDEMQGGKFHGGNGPDSVNGYRAGKLVSVESCSPTKACP